MERVAIDRRTLLRIGCVVSAGAVTPRICYSAVKPILTSRRSLYVYNTHTQEHLGATFFKEGQYDIKALNAINYVLRDHRTGDIHPISLRLLDLLYVLSRKINIRGPIHIISGYRSRATNEMLRRRGRGVSRNSLHIRGKAVDLRIPEFSTASLRHTAMALRAGGVGYYPRENFVHVDVGRIRYW